MTLASPTQSNPSDEILASSINNPVNHLATIINGGLDDSNISAISGTKVSAGTLPYSALDTNSNVETRMAESLSNFVASGCVWSALSGLNAAMTSGVIYVTGRRVAVSAIATRAFTASKDTYVSLDINGSPTYSEVANGAAAPSLPAASVWTYKVVTSGGAVTSVADLRSKPVTASQLTYGKLRSRQGGSATNWTTTGTTTYDYSGTNVFTQVGSVLSTDATTNSSNGWYATSAQTVTFPIAFSQPPMVIVTTQGDHAVAGLFNPPTTTSFTWKARASTSVGANVTIYWMAIGE